MMVEFLARNIMVHGEPWQTAEMWPDAECIPRKGELVKVTATAVDGARAKREMRVLEVCHADPGHVDIWLVPTNVNVP